MKRYTKYLIAAILTCTSYSVAGRIEVNFNAPTVESSTIYTANFLQIDSVEFSKNTHAEGDSLLLKIGGVRPLDDTKGNPIPLNVVRTIKFRPSNEPETMTVKVTAGELMGNHVFDLQDVAQIDFVEEDRTKDSDSDGIPDYREIHMYGTDPYSDDTDGDGWRDNVEIGRFSSSNPTKWNPKISDLPRLELTMVKTPEIYLNISKKDGSTRTENVTTGYSTADKEASTKSETHSSAVMTAWNISLTNTFAIVAGKEFHGARWTLALTTGRSGSETNTNGYTMSSTEEKTVTNNYSNSLAIARSQEETVSSAKVCVEGKITNIGGVAYTVESITSNLSAYYALEGLKTVTAVSPEASGQFTLEPGASQSKRFCNANVPLEQVGKLIYNPGAMFLDAASYKITMKRDGGNTDFTDDYTNSKARTATVVIDYGPHNGTHSVAEYMVATRYKPKMANVEIAEMYESVSLADLLKTLAISYKEDTIVNARGESNYALKTLNDVSYRATSEDTSMWFVAISKAVNPKSVYLYSPADAGFRLDTMMIEAGDHVQLIYNEDRDHDGVPASMEKLLGISDESIDSDEDGLGDYEEINGWVRKDENGDTLGVFRTNPAQKDTDGDDRGDGALFDKDDPNPNEQESFTNPYIESIVVKNNLTGVNYTALGKCATAGYMCAYTVFDLDSTITSGDVSVYVVTKEPVEFIEVKVNGAEYSGRYAILDSSKHYSFTLNGELERLLISKKNVITLRVTPQTGAAVESHLYINSNLKKPENFNLSRNGARNAIILSWTPYPDDERILGYVILRANGDKQKHNEMLASMNNNGASVVQSAASSLVSAIMPWLSGYTDAEPSEENLEKPIQRTTDAPVDGMNLGGGVIVQKVVASDVNTYTDNVGGGSPYYSYRVYAYTKEGDYYYFSPASDIKTRAVGRIKFDYQLTGVGVEYLYAWGFRLDAGVNAWLYNGSGSNSPQIYHYYYWFEDAGDVDKGNTVVYYDRPDIPGGQSNIDINTASYSDEIGSQGITLKLKATYDGGWYEAPISQHEIKWPYNNMVAVLNGASATSRDGNAPKQGGQENKFNWGQSGIEYNTPDTDVGNGCDNECGDEPHAGIKLRTNYSWADPD